MQQPCTVTFTDGGTVLHYSESHFFAESSFLQVVQELSAVKGVSRAKVDTGNPVPKHNRDLFCSVAELTDKESFSVNIRFMLRPKLVASIFKRRRSFSEIDSSAASDRRKTVGAQHICLTRSKSLNDLTTPVDMPGVDNLTQGKARTLPHSHWQLRDAVCDSHVFSGFSGKVSPSEARYIEESEGTDSEKEEAEFVDRKMCGSHLCDCYGDLRKTENCSHHKPGVQCVQPAIVGEGGRGAWATPTNRSKADRSAIKCRKKPQQQKMALPLSLRRYSEF